MVAIGVDQQFTNSDLYEHRCLGISRSYSKLQIDVMINRSTSND